MLVYDEKVPRHIWRIAIVPGENSKAEIVRIAKIIAIIKRPVNKPFLTEYAHHESNQTDKARGQKLR